MLKLTAVLVLCAAFLPAQTPPPEELFLEKPYLQLGNSPALAKSESLVLLWHTSELPADWKVELRTSKDSAWRAAPAPASQLITAPGIPAHLVYRAQLTGIPPGENFHYRVLKSGKPVFESTAQARKSASQPYRFVVFGDSAQGTPASRAVAYQASLVKPDFIMIPGDIVYSSGRISEYRDKFFPIYNPDQPSAEVGAPLIRSIPFIAAPGNHDTALANFSRFADALAFFLYWDEPTNGPAAPAGVDRVRHVLNGEPDAQKAFLTGAQSRYPAMANFSFDYGNAHWIVLDSNTYMDWTNATLRDWVTKDLAAAKSAQWRFVAFHHPGFNSSKTHFTDQWMRVLAPVFEAGKVDIVFNGHVHNYQRSYPLTFTPTPQPDDKLIGPKGEVAGQWKLDSAFGDGSKANPHGVIYLVTGGGGAGLYNTEQQADPTSWQPFTQKYVADRHSFSVVDIDGSTFHLRQVSDAGEEVDTFTIHKATH